MSFYNNGEIIMYLSGDKGTKQQIEDGLNRDLTTTIDIDFIIEKFQESLNLHNKVNIIIQKDMPKIITSYLSQLSELFQTIPHENISIVEIGLPNQLFKESNSLRFGDAVSFIEYSQNILRNEEAKKFETSSSKEDREFGSQYRKMMIENEAKKQKIQDLLGKLDESSEVIKKLDTKILSLENKINTIYTVETENALTENQRLKDDLKEMKRQRDSELNKNEMFEEELNKFRNKNVEHVATIQSYENVTRENRDESHIKDRKIRSLTEELNKERQEKVRMMQSKVNTEDMVVLNEQLIKERDAKSKLKEETDELKISIKTLQLKNGELVQDIESLRKGETDIEMFGRTSKIDSHEFNNTNVYYFKVFNYLPYFHSAIKVLKQILEENDKTVHVAIIKNDEGLDNIKYSEYPYYAKIGDVKRSDDLYRLYPSHKMLEDASTYEEKCDTLIVLDYIQSGDYYITTKAKHKICTVVRELEDMEKYNLQGKPITLGIGSVLNIEFDSKIKNSQTKEIKDRLIRKNVEMWISNGLLDRDIKL